MQTVYNVFVRLRKSLIVTCIILILMIMSAILIHYLESQVFSLVGYKWKGPTDISFGILTLLESLSGLWVSLIYLPQKIGKNNFRNIFSGKHPNELFGYVIAGVVGFFMGLSFSGIWKIILIATYFY